MIKLNAGFSRKVGEANFSSRGASVNVELELESSVVSDPERMQERIRSLFALVKRAVDEELQNGNGGVKPPSPVPVSQPETPVPQDPVCSECGAGQLGGRVIQFSTEKFGKPLCYRCQRRAGARPRKEVPHVVS